MQRSRKTRLRRLRGFTLVELLVSTAVLGLLLVLLAQVANMVTNTWTQGQGRAERRQNGRALVDFIGRELRAASIPVSLETSITTPNLQFVLNPSSVGNDWRNPSALFWQAPVATDVRQGDMAVLGYFVRWDESGDRPRASLCRVFLNPGDPDHMIYKQNHADTWITGDLLNKIAPADKNGSYRGLFAENVIGFWARCLDSRGEVISNATGQGFDSRKDYTAPDVNGNSVVHKAPVLPTSVEISIVLLDARSASKITPQMKAGLIGLAGSSRDADACIQQLQSDNLYRPIVAGATAHKVRVYLENSP